MTTLRAQPCDPRTVARDIPGICDALFPQLAPGVVVHLNRTAWSHDACVAVEEELIRKSSMQHAMLFEIAVAAGEQLIDGAGEIDFTAALGAAVVRQRRHFDAKVPIETNWADVEIVRVVSSNLKAIVGSVQAQLAGQKVVRSPRIPGYSWISSGVGDFAIGDALVEVKCTNKPFGSADFRQVLLYWLLSYSAALEGKSREWEGVILINPRLNTVVEFRVDELIATVGAGRTKVELVELFSSMISAHSLRMMSVAWR